MNERKIKKGNTMVNIISEKSKYYPLKQYLKNVQLTLSFDEIEKIIGEKLPQSAYQYREWWQDEGHYYSYAWIDAGWSLKSVDFGHSVTFEKI